MKGWMVIVVVAMALLVLAPFAVFAGTDTNNGITLNLPDDTTECAPTFYFSTTGMNPAWTLDYNVVEVIEQPDGTTVFNSLASGTITGDLNVSVTPDPLAAGESQQYAIFVKVQVPGQPEPTVLNGKWTVECPPDEEPTPTPTETPKPDPTKTVEPPTATPTPEPPTATPTPAPGGEGCTPGYWKNHVEAWPDLADDDFDATFGRDAFNPNITMIAATDLKGGHLNALARHAAAAYANASHAGVDYDLEPEVVVETFQEAFDSGDFETTKDYFELLNEQGCPL